MAICVRVPRERDSRARISRITASVRRRLDGRSRREDRRQRSANAAATTTSTHHPRPDTVPPRRPCRLLTEPEHQSDEVKDDAVAGSSCRVRISRASRKMRAMGRRGFRPARAGRLRGRRRRAAARVAAAGGGRRSGDRARSARRRLRRVASACRRCHPDHYHELGADLPPHDDHGGDRRRTCAATSRARRCATRASTARMDRDAAGGYRMTFTTARGRAANRRGRARRRARAAISSTWPQVGDTLWRLPVAYHVEEKRWFPMTGAFLFPDDAHGRRRRAPDLRRRRVRSPRHALERQLRLLPQRRAQPGPRSVDGRRSRPPSPSWASPARRATVRAPRTRAPTPIRRGGTRCTWPPRADPTIVNPSRLPPARADQGRPGRQQNLYSCEERLRSHQLARVLGQPRDRFGRCAGRDSKKAIELHNQYPRANSIRSRKTSRPPTCPSGFKRASS